MATLRGVRHLGLALLVIEAMKLGKIDISPQAAEAFVKKVFGKPDMVDYDHIHNLPAATLEAAAGHIQFGTAFAEAGLPDFRRLEAGLKVVQTATLQCLICKRFGLKNVGLNWQTLPSGAACKCGHALELFSREVTHMVAWGLDRNGGLPQLKPIVEGTFSLLHLGYTEEFPLLPDELLERIHQETGYPVLPQIIKVCEERRIELADLIEEAVNGLTGARLGKNVRAWLSTVTVNSQFSVAEINAIASRAAQTVRAREVREANVATKVVTSPVTTSSPTTSNEAAKEKIPHIHIVVAAEDVKTYLAPLEAALSVLEGRGDVRITHSGRVKPGAVWRDVLRENIARADKVLFMVSSDSLANEECDWQLGLCEDEQIQLLLLRSSMYTFVKKFAGKKPLVEGQILAKLSVAEREEAIIEAIGQMMASP